MDFELNDEQQMIRKMVREFAEKELAPHAAEVDAKGQFPLDAIRKMGELGLLGLNVPEAYGGAGADMVSYALAIEEIARACGSTALTVAAHALCTTPLNLFGSEEQKRKYLVPLAQGKLGAFGLTEPGAGSDAAAAKTTAVRDGDWWVLNGSKIFITNGGLADVLIIVAVTDKSKGTRGISAFIVEKGTPGFTPGREEEKMGLRGSLTSQLFFENCRVPAANLLGSEGDGFKYALATLDSGRIGIGAMSVGLAQAALEASLRYAKERVQFGQPIASFQAIQWMLADMGTQIEAARLLVHRAATLKDKGQRFTKEAAMAKLFASEMAERACHKAIQIHGGYGYVREYAVERFYRDVRLCEIGEGTSEVQRLVIARQLLG
jgi:alkylation response protein AidB-like acyl-CoA dehydrogenase